jgi:chemotaxis response regulator CheB
MDVLMPGLDGVSATARIMRECPCPVVVMSSLVGAAEQKVVFEAIGAGALEVIGKPRNVGDKRTRIELAEQLKTIVAAAAARAAADSPEPTSAVMALAPPHVPSAVRVVLIGASTGGPQALVEILKRLPKSFPASIVLAQHLARGFAEGMCRWLRECTELKIQIATRPVRLAVGTVYVAPDDQHIELHRDEVRPAAAGGDALTPGVDRLFESAAASARGVVGIVLTGMGTDGARGLRLLRDKGCYTIAQDEASSLIYGMPRAAWQLGAAIERLAPAQIGRRLVGLCATGGQG